MDLNQRYCKRIRSSYEFSIYISRKQSQVQVDAFAVEPFTGNPAAVVLMSPLSEKKGEKWMQQLAMENNLAETSFMSKRSESDSEFNIRWFTPLKEVDLCGHATLASAHFLYESVTN